MCPYRMGGVFIVETALGVLPETGLASHGRPPEYVTAAGIMAISYGRTAAVRMIPETVRAACPQLLLSLVSRVVGWGFLVGWCVPGRGLV